jgi:Fe-S cluster assembly iron-binding protein IscA
MIVITDDAKKELKKILTENAQDPNIVLRLTANEQGQLGLVMDNVTDGDNVIEYDGSKVLAIEEHFASHLEGISLEVEDTPEGPMLTLMQAGCGGGCCCGGEEGSHEEQGCGGGGGSCCEGGKPS